MKASDNDKVTIATLAECKRIPEAFLRGVGLHETSAGVAIPYHGKDGEEQHERKRVKLSGNYHTLQPKGTPLTIYGAWRLEDAERDGFVVLVEGESDCWALWHNGFPAIGPPGSNTARTILKEHVEALADIYVVQEPGKGGEEFVAGVGRRLADLGWQGNLWRLRMPGGIKDPSALHIDNPDTFKERMGEAIEGAEKLVLPVWQEPTRAPVGSVGSVTRVRYRPLPPYHPFPLDTLPPVVRDLVDAASAAIGCDSALVALPALTTVAGAIGNSRAVRLKRGWAEPAVIWALTVAESGAYKSPAFEAAVGSLTHIQMDAFDSHAQEMEDHNLLLEAWKETPKDERGEKPQEPPGPPIYTTSDATIEALGQLLQDHPRGLLMARDELDAWFQSFTRYKGRSGGTDRAQWLELHRAGTLRVDRMTQGRRLAVRRAAVSVCGGIQPQVLARALDREALASGLAARFLMAYPPKKKRVWSEAEVDESIQNRYRGLLLSLLGLGLANAEKRDPHILTLSPEAKSLWVDFFNSWGQVQHDAEGEQASALSKLEAYGARLALVHHVVAHVACDADDRAPITAASMQAGIDLARWFANEAWRLYGMLAEKDEEREVRKLVEWIEGHRGQTTVRALQRSSSGKYPDSASAEAALNGLVDADLAHWIDPPPAPHGGNPARILELCRDTSDTSDTCSPLEEVDSDTTPKLPTLAPPPTPSNKGTSHCVANGFSTTMASQQVQVSEVSNCRKEDSEEESVASKCRTPGGSVGCPESNGEHGDPHGWEEV